MFPGNISLLDPFRNTKRHDHFFWTCVFFSYFAYRNQLLYYASTSSQYHDIARLFFFDYIAMVLVEYFTVIMSIATVLFCVALAMEIRFACSSDSQYIS
jgi:hypothetical protein